MPFFVVVGNLSRPGTALNMNLTCCWSFLLFSNCECVNWGERWEKDGVLYQKQAGPMAGVINMQCVVSSKEEQTRLIRACHVGTDVGNHYGHDKTLRKVKQH